MDKNTSHSDDLRQFAANVPESAMDEFANLELDDDCADYVEVIRKAGQLQTD
jgi:hypothetical protein